MNTFTATIPARAYADMMDAVNDTACAPSATDAQRQALVDYDAAVRIKRGGGHAYVISSATADAWDVLVSEAQYRWEINGGNGNPYGVDEPGAYMAARQACRVAYRRMAAAREAG